MSLTLHNDWETLDRTYPWIHALQGVPQDPVYHAEGDVWVHTRMVLEALETMDEWKAMEEEQRLIVWWACLLHDVAKPQCTLAEPDGRICSPRHAVKGEQQAREILWKGVPEPVSFAMREAIVKLVRFHGLPLWAMEKKDPDRAVIQASLHIDLRLLAMVAEADVRGRICADQEKLLERIEYFRLYARELNCYDQPYPFSSDLARFTYFNRPGNVPSYDPFDDTRCEVTLLSGLPGSGKDSWVRDFGEALPVISLDALRISLNISPNKPQGRVAQAAREKAREYLREGHSFIWNATNITRVLRRPLIDLFSTYKARVRIVYVEVPYHTLLDQNSHREEVVPQKVLHRLIHKLEVPGPEEAHAVEFVVSC